MQERTNTLQMMLKIREDMSSSTKTIRAYLSPADQLILSLVAELIPEYECAGTFLPASHFANVEDMMTAPVHLTIANRRNPEIDYFEINKKGIILMPERFMKNLSSKNYYMRGIFCATLTKDLPEWDNSWPEIYKSVVREITKDAYLPGATEKRLIS